MTGAIPVLDQGERIEFSFEDLMRYHGPGSPGGVAHAFKVMERAWPELDGAGPPERRELGIRTAFGGPGARDALERFVFELRYRGRSVTLQVREGFVTDEFIDLARKEGRSAEEERRLTALKREMADRVMAAPATDVYETA